MARAVVAILALVIVAGVGIYGLQVALADVGDTNTVTNETWQPDAGNVTTLDESNRLGAYYDNETTVYDENDTLQDEGTDYRWFESNGTVKALGGGGLEGDSSATISYSYQQTTDVQRQFTALVGNVPLIIGLALPLLGFALILRFLTG